MTETTEVRRTLSEQAARQLANATKTHAQWSGITPRWLPSFLPWVAVEAGIFRLNRVKETSSDVSDGVECSPKNDADLPETYIDYDPAPREYSLNAVTTVLDIQTRVSDLYSSPIDQIQEQVRLLIEKVKEQQESQLLNNVDYGLLNNIIPSHRTVSKIGTKRAFGNWKQVDQVPLNQAKPDLKNTQVASIFAVNKMAQTFMNSAPASRD